jgi:hypothetical protein
MSKQRIQRTKTARKWLRSGKRKMAIPSYVFPIPGCYGTGQESLSLFPLSNTCAMWVHCDKISSCLFSINPGFCARLNNPKLQRRNRRQKEGVSHQGQIYKLVSFSKTIQLLFSVSSVSEFFLLKGRRLLAHSNNLRQMSRYLIVLVAAFFVNFT